MVKPKYGGNVFDGVAFVPGGGCPKIVGGSVVKEFMCPDTF